MTIYTVFTQVEGLRGFNFATTDREKAQAKFDYLVDYYTKGFKRYGEVEQRDWKYDGYIPCIDCQIISADNGQKGRLHEYHQVIIYFDKFDE